MLKVPLYYQPKGASYCGPACARMVFAYHGINKSLRSILKDLPMTKHGVGPAALGMLFLEHSFNVRLYIWLREFPNRFLHLESRESINKELIRWCKRKVKDNTEKNI